MFDYRERQLKTHSDLRNILEELETLTKEFFLLTRRVEAIAWTQEIAVPRMGNIIFEMSEVHFLPAEEYRLEEFTDLGYDSFVTHHVQEWNDMWALGMFPDKDCDDLEWDLQNKVGKLFDLFGPNVTVRVNRSGIICEV